jgi:hypothetical protein
MADSNSGEFDNCMPFSNAFIFIVGLVGGTDVVVGGSERFREDHIVADREGLSMVKAIAAINCAMMMCADWK